MRVLLLLLILFSHYVFSDNFVFVNELSNITEAQREATGKGVNVGIIDDGVTSHHISLKGKIIGEIFAKDPSGKELKPDYKTDTHGSHVGGIIAGSKLDDNKPHGVAYDAKLYSAPLLSREAQTTPNAKTPNVKEYFGDSAKNIKIINNSWGFNIYPIINAKEDNQTQLYKYEDYTNYNINSFLSADDALKYLYNLALDKKTLMVFASGNEGMISPGMQAILPSYDENLRAWLSVGSLNATDEQGTTQYITKDNNGKLIVKSKGVSDFSNAFKGAENYSLMAFGGFINNVDSKTSDSFIQMSGTSMAAPMVSGVATLVQEKFPFLDGKQIADTLLSTANKDYEAPKLVVKSTKQLDTTTQKEKEYYSIFYIDNTIPKNGSGNDTAQIKQDLESAGYTSQEAREIIDNPITINNYDAIQEVSKETIFGQGIIDAKKALGGLSLLDANRLNDSDIKESKSQPNTKEAYYTIDTQGYSATFSNDINQKQWDSKLHPTNIQAQNVPSGLQNLNVGFIKNGLGTLTFSGTNRYKGDTIIQGGALKLLRHNANSGELTESNVFVESSGTLSGNGTIHKNLHNSGIVRPGNQDLSDLIVKGSYTQEGEQSKLQLDFGNNKNSKLIANSYTIKSGILEYIPLAQYYTSGTSITIDLDGLEQHLDDFTSVNIEDNNAIEFGVKLDTDKKTINATTSIKNTAYNIQNSTIGNAMRAIRADRNLPQDYQNYFAKFDNTNPSTHQSTLKSIANTNHLDMLENTINTNASFSQQNMLFALDPSSFITPQIAPVKISSAGDTWQFLDIDKKEYYLYVTPHYAYIDDANYYGHQYGVQINLAKQIEHNVLTFNASFADSYLKYSYGNLNKDSFSISTNYHHNFGFLRLLSGLNFSYTQNTMDYTIQNAQTPLNANYDTYIISTQLGVAKDFAKNNFVITPLVYFGYDYTHQDAFKENSNALWAKHYNKISHHATSLNAGVHMSYLNTLNNFDTKLSLFALQKYQLSGDRISNQISFIDFPTQSFAHTQYLNRHITTFGLSYGLFSHSFFTNLGVYNQLARQYSNVNIFATIGFFF